VDRQGRSSRDSSGKQYNRKRRNARLLLGLMRSRSEHTGKASGLSWMEGTRAPNVMRLSCGAKLE